MKFRVLRYNSTIRGAPILQIYEVIIKDLKMNTLVPPTYNLLSTIEEKMLKDVANLQSIPNNGG